MIFSEIIAYLTSSHLLAILFATLCGMLVGLEREISQKPAGIRTCALVCIGSALFTILSTLVVGPTVDPGRIASNVVQGIGFLGAGAIITTRDKVIGMTTAAAIWVVAAIGMSIGFGYYMTALLTTLLTVTIMFVIGIAEKRFVEKINVFNKRRGTK
jgi:putative Mg2+ transporter-C (MgtC) family protein